MFKEFQQLRFKGKSIFERIIFQPPMKASEKMKDEACFIYSVDGHSTIFGGRGAKEIAPNQGALLKCGSFVNNWYKKQDNSTTEVIVIHFYPSILKEIYSNGIPWFLKEGSRSSRTQVQILQEEAIVKNFINGLFFYFQNPHLADEHLVGLKIRELILLLFNLGNEGVHELLAGLFTEEEVGFKQIIENNLYKDLSVEDLAFLCNLSLSSFKRKFKEVYQESPAKYIKKRRLERAAELLQYSSEQITAVCFNSGFNDVGHFSKSFKVKYGISPRDFRKRA